MVDNAEVARWAVETAGLPRDQVETARAEADASGSPLADLLVVRGMVPLDRLPDFLAAPGRPLDRITLVAADPASLPPEAPAGAPGTPVTASRGDSGIADTMPGGPGDGPSTLILDRLPSLPVAGGAAVAAPPPVPRAEPLHGPRKFGKFLLLEELGSGGMGTVYRAFQTDLEREVALKTLHGAAAAGSTQIERFHREARAVARLEHPGIVRVFEIGREENVDYFTMEYVAGHNLGERVARNAPPVPERVRWIRDSALALQHAHEQKLIHRDLKPTNLLVNAWGAVKVADFGLARDITTGRGITLSGQALGTPHYMSPEQAAGEHDRIGPASDIYSLGATLYEILAGTPPVEGKEVLQVMQNVADGKVIPLRKVAPHLPRDLETIVMKALDPEPERRFASMAEFAADLDRFLRFEAIRARPLTWRHRLHRDLRRHGRKAAFVGVLLLLAGAGALWGWARLEVLEADAGRERERARQERAAAELRSRAQDLLHRAANPSHVLAQGGAREQVRLLREAIQLAPELAEPHFRLGTVHEGTGALAEAEQAYREARRLDPGLVRAHARLALLLLHSALDRAEGPARFRQGEELLAELERWAPQDPFTRYVRLFRDALGAEKPKLEETVAELETLADRVPESLLLRAGLHGVYLHPAGEISFGRKLRNLDLALAELTAYNGLDPLNFLARMNLGVLRIEAGDFVGAESDLEFVIQNAPEWAEPRQYLGRLRYNQGRLAEAERALREAQKLTPSPSRANFLALVLAFRKDYAGALDVIAETQAPGTIPPDTRFLRGFLFYCAGRDGEAQPDFRAFAEDQEEWVTRLRKLAEDLKKPVGAMLAESVAKDLLHFPEVLFLAPEVKLSVRRLFRAAMTYPGAREMVQKYREGTAMRREVEEITVRFAEMKRDYPEMISAWRKGLAEMKVDADVHVLLSLMAFGTKLARDAELREQKTLHRVEDCLWRAGYWYRAGKPERMRDDLRAALRFDAASAKAWYGLATAHALLGEAAECADALRSARQCGWANLRFAEDDADFEKVREAPAVKRALAEGK